MCYKQYLDVKITNNAKPTNRVMKWKLRTLSDFDNWIRKGIIVNKQFAIVTSTFQEHNQEKQQKFLFRVQSSLGHSLLPFSSILMYCTFILFDNNRVVLFAIYNNIYNAVISCTNLLYILIVLSILNVITLYNNSNQKVPKNL